MRDDRLHVVPQWEEHENSPDCWCEPTIAEDGNLVVHHAATCKRPFDVHHWVWKKDPDKPYVERSECAHCGQPRKHVNQGWPC